LLGRPSGRFGIVFARGRCDLARWESQSEACRAECGRGGGGVLVLRVLLAPACLVHRAATHTQDRDDGGMRAYIRY
jgi:hypothetical protein